MNTTKHDVPEALLSGLLANYKKPEDLIGENGLLKQLTKLLVERALEAELTEHLGHQRHEAVANAGGNTRNGRALLHKSKTRRPSPYPGRTYATGTVTGRPSCVKRLSSATRTCSSTTWRSNVRAITRSPSRLKQCILVSTRLRRW